MKKTILILFCCLALTACGQETIKEPTQKGTTYAKAGIRYDCPPSWEISIDEQTLENDYFSSCKQKQGSGLITFKIHTQPISERQMLDTLVEGYRDLYKKMNVNVEYDEMPEKADTVDYKFTARDIDFEGSIQTKKCPDSTVGIIFQHAKKDKGSVEKEFERINNSISCL
jgi:hypothetical protein